MNNDGYVWYSLYIQSNHISIFFHWLCDREMITATARFALKMTPVSLQERRRLLNCAFIIYPKLIVFAFFHLERSKEKVCAGNGYARSQNTNLSSVTENITEPFFQHVSHCNCSLFVVSMSWCIYVLRMAVSVLWSIWNSSVQKHKSTFTWSRLFHQFCEFKLVTHWSRVSLTLSIVKYMTGHEQQKRTSNTTQGMITLSISHGCEERNN